MHVLRITHLKSQQQQTLLGKVHHHLYFVALKENTTAWVIGIQWKTALIKIVLRSHFITKVNVLESMYQSARMSVSQPSSIPTHSLMQMETSLHPDHQKHFQTLTLRGAVGGDEVLFKLLEGAILVNWTRIWVQVQVVMHYSLISTFARILKLYVMGHQSWNG